jgi:sarcosine oxidase
MKRFDVAVVGLGVMGAATAWRAAQSGSKVIALDARGPLHEQGSSHGGSRIFRRAYWEGESYLPLLELAHEGWEELHDISSKQLIVRTGGVFIGPKSTGVVDGSLRTAQHGGIPHEHLSAAELALRFPQFSVDEEMCAVYEPGAYAIAADDARLAMLSEAARHGAMLRFGEAVTAIESTGNGVVLETTHGEKIVASAVIVCAGPWIAQRLLPELRPYLNPSRVPIYWFKPKLGHEKKFAPARFPVFLYEMKDGALLYGVPAGVGGENGVKIGFHNRQQLSSDPDMRAGEVASALQAEVGQCVERVLPQILSTPILAQSCFYTMSADESFLIGESCDMPAVYFASACSGHGFKFAPAIGGVMAALARGMPPPTDVSAFNVGRFGHFAI